MDGSDVWIEKYRPKKLSEMMLEDDVFKHIDIFIHGKKNSHLIITGRPGVGKTSTARCIAKDILGDNFNQGYVEINAAEERGTKNISSIIQPFCKKMVDFASPKIIMLDEADNITTKCQYDIKLMMDKYGTKTKFIFTCNESSKIIEDIQGICKILRYKNISDNQISEYLSNICAKENIEYDEEGIRMLCQISEGDMRKSINDLQKTAYTYNIVTKDTVLRICKVPDPCIIQSIVDECFKKNIRESTEKIELIIRDGFCYSDILSGFTHVLTHNKNIDEYDRIRLIDIVTDIKIIIGLGLHSKLQMCAMVCRMIQYIIENNAAYID